MPHLPVSCHNKSLLFAHYYCVWGFSQTGHIRAQQGTHLLKYSCSLFTVVLLFIVSVILMVNYTPKMLCRKSQKQFISLNYALFLRCNEISYYQDLSCLGVLGFLSL